MADDAYLIRQYVEARSEAAFSELVRRHLALVYYSALRQLDGDSHLAQDVAQAVFVLLAEKSLTLRSHPSVAGWLYTTTHFKVAKARRAERRRKHWEAIASSSLETVTNHPAGVEPEQLGALIDQAILNLNRRDREAVLLRFFEGQAYAEIATRLSLTEKTAQKRVERALEKLRVRLARRGITSTSAALTASLITQSGMAAPAELAARVFGAAVPPLYPLTTFAALKLMSTTKTAAGIAALVGILAVGSALHETAVLHQTTATLATADRERKLLEDEAEQLTQSTQALEKSLAGLKPGMITANSGRAATSHEPHATANAAMAGGAGVKAAPSAAAFNRDPKIHDLVGKLVAWNNANYFGPLLQSAGLSEAQVTRAEYLIGQTASFGGLGPTPLSYQTDPQADPRTASNIQAELFQVIGEAGTASLNTYQVVRFVTDGLAGYLNGSDEPLTMQQAAQLTQIMVSTNQSTASPGNPGNWLNPQATDWSAALAQAQGVLSPNQLAVFKNLAISNFGANLK